ncbi:hypothetical protein CCHR01_19314 [Colletotrichum chrysophilum]|uniref:Uncharacterized protein n=1 Tax=Colletotrichum chrysophilum TaxID=1836956 RepID=A0AAD8ZYU9_9PEZI|nr:hypothetical protein CCHR01_19314 [Colletotrichum chrysophilum]
MMNHMQHRAFADRLRPDYYFGPHWFIDGGADGTPSSPVGVVACASCMFRRDL